MPNLGQRGKLWLTASEAQEWSVNFPNIETDTEQQVKVSER